MYTDLKAYNNQLAFLLFSLRDGEFWAAHSKYTSRQASLFQAYCIVVLLDTVINTWISTKFTQRINCAQTIREATFKCEANE